MEPSLRSSDSLYRLGGDSTIETGVILGYAPTRDIDVRPCEIGACAHVRSNSVIYTNSLIGSDMETGHNVVIREECNIGTNFKIWNNSCIDYGCVIGNNVRIHSMVYLSQFTTLEDDVFLAPGVTTANDLCPICCECILGPTVKKGSRGGANATILPHVVVGENSLIGAGSVVTSDIPANSVAYGNPAKVTRDIHDLPCRAGKRKFAYPSP